MSLLGKIFKNKLDQRQFEFREEYWKDLEKKLDTPGVISKKTKWNLLSGSISILLLSSLAIWFFYPANKNEFSQERSMAAKAVGPDMGESEKTLGKQFSSADPANAEKYPSRSTGKTKERVFGKENLNEKDIASVGNNHSEKTLRKESQTAIKIADEEENPMVSKYGKPVKNEQENSVQKRLNPEENIVAEIAARNEQSPENAGQGKMNPESRNEIPEGFSSGGVNVLSGEIIANAPDPISLSEENSEISGFQASLNPFMTPGTGTIDHFPAMIKIFPPVLIGNPNEAVIANPSVKIKQHRKSRFFAGICSGMMYTDKILKNKDALLNEYISRRKNEESGTFSLNYGIDAGLHFNRWNIGTGINYHIQGEVTDYKSGFYQWLRNSTTDWNILDNSYWETDTINTVEVIAATGTWQPAETVVWNNNLAAWDTITINQYVVDSTYTQYYYFTDSLFVPDFDSSAIITIDSSRQLVNDPSMKPEKTTTKISYVEVPLLVGYEFPLSRFTLMVRTGFSVGLLSKYTASYLKKDMSGIEQFDSSRLNKTVFNYLFRAGVLYNITGQVAISFEPMFRMNINSVLKDAGFTQQYWNAGMNAGVVYRF